MSKILNSKKPSPAIIQICLADGSFIVQKPMAKNVTAWPANSSTTISLGSAFLVVVITAGLNLAQTTEPAKARAAITIEINKGDEPR